MYYVALYSLILRSTGTTSHSLLLIDDHLINQLNVDMTSGLIVEDISDHLTLFTVI